MAVTLSVQNNFVVITDLYPEPQYFNIGQYTPKQDNGFINIYDNVTARDHNIGFYSDIEVGGVPFTSANDVVLWLSDNKQQVETSTSTGNTLIFGAFGEQLTSHLTPIVQLSNKYQQDPSVLSSIEIFSATGGSTDNSSNLFRCQTGTSLGGYGVLRSKDTINYRAGQGIVAMITASFTAGIPLSLQFGGMFNLTDTIAFGFDGSDFSCLHSYGGVAESQLITITATGAGTCNLTLNNDLLAITVTNSTTQENAFEIKNAIDADPTLSSKWRAEQVDNTVLVIAKNAEVRTGTYSISGGVTATIVQQKAGVTKTNNHIHQSSWNKTTTPFAGFDPTKINIYKIQYGYLGSANIEFSIYNAETSKFVLVNEIKWANLYNITSTLSPNFKIGWTAASLGSTGTNLTVTGASGSLMLEGDERLVNDTFAASSSKGSIATTLTNILTVKNRIAYNSIYNLGKIIPLRVSIDNDHTKGLIVEILRNPTVAGVTNFQYINQDKSTAIIDTAGTTVTGGTLIDSFVVEKGATATLDLDNLITETIADQTFVIAAKTISGTGATVTVATTWKEEK